MSPSTMETTSDQRTLHHCSKMPCQLTIWKRAARIVDPSVHPRPYKLFNLCLLRCSYYIDNGSDGSFEAQRHTKDYPFAAAYQLPAI